ncbi:peptidoglycan DD-metalloendopeptidase family protein [bacterium]|nr:peptidoglycan DD-metalloendopeptidase family protein [bacterium]
MIRALICLLALASPAGAFQLQWPVDCTLGQTCHIQHYVDRDPGPGARDFSCGTLSYDGHDGTDIALPNRAAMAGGVKVLAAAPGRVLGLRDGVPDFAPPMPGKECGNGVLVDDGDGWQTQYCHMKQGSVAVHKGDMVAIGTPLGLVGQSGAAEFPHLHLTVRHEGKPVDPFQPDPGSCGPASSAGLWDRLLPYEPGGFLAAGFSSEVPQFEAIQAGLPVTPLPSTVPALVLWAEVFGGQAGDEMEFSITAPDGSPMLSSTAKLERTQDQLFRAVGKKLHAALPAGTYGGEIVLRRKGAEVGRIATQVVVTP